VPNLTIGPPVIKKMRGATSLPLDVHLMIETPEASIAQYVEAGADLLTVHIEACADAEAVLMQIKDAGVKAGIALNPATPAKEILSMLHLVDLVLVMTVNPGFGGQSFISEALPKLSAIKALCAEKSFKPRFEVDGGINGTTIVDARVAGADTFVAGTAVFGQNDYAQAIRGLRAAMEI
jgi:ribulose-phosphate 3-epimerase